MTTGKRKACVKIKIQHCIFICDTFDVKLKGGADRLTPIKIFYLKLTQIILKKLKPLMY